MTSKYFHRDPDHSFETIHQYDPSMQFYGETWSLKPLPPRPLWSFQPEVFTLQECQSIIVLGERLGPKRATLMRDTIDDKTRKSFTSWIAPSKYSEWIYKRITDYANLHNEQYFQYDLDAIEKIQFTKYVASEKGFYGTHIDNFDYPGYENRKLSLSIQLTDPIQYEGGDVVLKPAGKDLVMDKDLGMGIFFPSHTPHEVKPITKGTRYSLVVWFLGKNMR